jgi:hypothetical protein
MLFFSTGMVPSRALTRCNRVQWRHGQKSSKRKAAEPEFLPRGSSGGTQAMTIHVIKDDKGNVIATVRVGAGERFGLHGARNRARAPRVQRVELPRDVDALSDPRRLRENMKKPDR